MAVQPEHDVVEAVEEGPNLVGRRPGVVVLRSGGVLTEVGEGRESVVRGEHDEPVGVAGRDHAAVG